MMIWKKGYTLRESKRLVYIAALRFTKYDIKYAAHILNIFDKTLYNFVAAEIEAQRNNGGKLEQKEKALGKGSKRS